MSVMLVLLVTCCPGVPTVMMISTDWSSLPFPHRTWLCFDSKENLKKEEISRS
jgi:hypothetical protein